MEINRRGFIARLVGGVVLAKILPEGLIGIQPKVMTATEACIAEECSLDSSEFLRQLNTMTPNYRDFYFRSSSMLKALRDKQQSTFKGGDYNA